MGATFCDRSHVISCDPDVVAHFCDNRSMRALWSVVVLGACGGGGDEAPADAAIDAAPLCTHIQNLRVYRGRAQTFGTTNGARFEGMVCVDGRTDLGCAFPDLESRFELCVPSGTEFGLRFKNKPGYDNIVYLNGPNAVSGFDQQPYTVGDTGFVESMIWTPVGGTYPPTTQGHLVVIVTKDNGDGTRSGLPGAEVAILPSAGLTVHYFGDNDLPEMNRTTTAASGIAVIPNVAPGMYDLQINSMTHPSCASRWGGYPSPDNSQDARIPAIAGTTVAIELDCRP